MQKEERSPKDLKSKGETKDRLDYGLQWVALCGGWKPDQAGQGRLREAAALNPVYPSFLPSFSPLEPGSKKHGEVAKQSRRSLPVHFLLKVS